MDGTRNTPRESRIAIRHFAWDDAPALVELLHDVTNADGMGWTPSLEEFRREFGGPLARPERDILLAESGGRLIGVAMVWMEGREHEPHPVAPLLFRVHPDYRDSDAGARLLDMALAQAHRLGAATIQGGVWPAESYKRDLLLARGFTYARSWWRLRASLAGPIDVPTLPAGFHVRPYQGCPDDAPLVALINDIFSTHYLDRTYTVADVQHWTSDDGFDPDLLHIVVAEDGDWPAALGLAGYVWGWADPDDDERAGFIGDLGVRDAYRGRGLGRWLLRRSMADLRARGMIWADLDVDGTNDQARRLYESEGFQVREEVLWYEKRIRESANRRMDE